MVTNETMFSSSFNHSNYVKVFRERKVNQVYQVVMVVLVFQVSKVIAVLMDIQVYFLAIYSLK